jgi:hypothetical protein
MKFLAFLVSMLVSALAVAQEAATYLGNEYIADPTLWSRFVSVAPDWLLVGIPFVVAVMLAARGASEALLAIKDKTETNLDNKAYSILNMVSSILGKGLGYIGVGMPKKMIEEKAKKAEDSK